MDINIQFCKQDFSWEVYLNQAMLLTFTIKRTAEILRWQALPASTSMAGFDSRFRLSHVLRSLTRTLSSILPEIVGLWLQRALRASTPLLVFDTHCGFWRVVWASTRALAGKTATRLCCSGLCRHSKPAPELAADCPWCPPPAAALWALPGQQCCIWIPF